MLAFSDYPCDFYGARLVCGDSPPGAASLIRRVQAMHISFEADPVLFIQTEQDAEIDPRMTDD